MSQIDPFLRPNTSFENRLRRAMWSVVRALLFVPSPRSAHAWRALILRAFGARLGANSRIYPGARIWAPWNLVCEDLVAIADGAEIYNAALVTLGSHAIVSQGAFVCTATHDYDDPAFPMTSLPITIGRYAWIAARASVCPGVRVGDGAVLGLASVATRDLAPWTVHAGVPAVAVKRRQMGGPSVAVRLEGGHQRQNTRACP